MFGIANGEAGANAHPNVELMSTQKWCVHGAGFELHFIQTPRSMGHGSIQAMDSFCRKRNFVGIHPTVATQPQNPAVGGFRRNFSEHAQPPPERAGQGES